MHNNKKQLKISGINTYVVPFTIKFPVTVNVPLDNVPVVVRFSSPNDIATDEAVIDQFSTKIGA